MQRIVLAYSGGRNSSLAIPWLQAKYRAEVVVVSMELGLGRELEAARNRALAMGAARAHVLDVRHEFARDFVLPSIRAGALDEGGSPSVAGLSRPLIARKLVDIAELERADAVAHGGGGRGGRLALDVLVPALEPGLALLTPAREPEWDDSRSAAQDLEGLSSVESNLWGRSVEYPALEGSRETPEHVFRLTRSAAECPDEPAHVHIAYERGAPVSVNGVVMPLLELIASLGTIASAHGVGRIDVVHRRRGTAGSREVVEAPAAVLLHAGHEALEKAALSRDFSRCARMIGAQYSDIIRSGQWFSPLRAALDAFVDVAQERVSGVVRFTLHKGAYSVVVQEAGTPAHLPAPVAIAVTRIR